MKNKNSEFDDIFNYLDGDVSLESIDFDGLTDDELDTDDEIAEEGSVCLEGAEDDAYVLLSALEEESTPDEFLDLLESSAIEMEMYGLIPSAQIALEAQKNIVRLNKVATFSRLQKRTAIRLAAKKNDTEYKKYRRGRDMMIAAREKIMAKYGSIAKGEARKSMTNAKKKAVAMKSSGGRSIEKKIDRTINKLDNNARNKNAIKGSN